MQTSATTPRIGVTVAPDTLQLPPGTRAQVVVAVANQGVVVDTFGLLVDGIDPSWYTLTAGTVSLMPGTSGPLGFDVHLPEGPAARAGQYAVQIRVVSRIDPAEGTVAELALEVMAFGRLELALAPLLVTTRNTARYRVALANPGNAEQVVDVSVSDPENALETTLADDRVAAVPGERREVALTVRPKQRPLVARPRRYRFTVAVAPADVDGAEPLATADGELERRAPLAFLAGITPRLRRWLLALLGLLVALAIFIWMVTRPGNPFPLIRQVLPFIPTVEAPPQPEVPDPQAEPTPAGQPGAGIGTVAGAGTSGGPTAAPARPTPRPGGPAAAPPVVATFELRAPPNAGRGEFDLNWDVQRADQVRVWSVRGGQRTPLEGGTTGVRGTRRVQALEDREFLLEATGPGGSAFKSLGIVLLRPPEIQAFAADPETIDSGGQSTLRWEVLRAARLGVTGTDQRPGDAAKGSLMVQPQSDTSYTLVAENDLGRDMRSVTVRVRQP